MARNPRPRQEEAPCHCTALRKASRRVSQIYDQALAPSGLKTTQRAILAQLRRSGTLSVGALAEALVKEASGFTNTLKPLERDGFIQLKPDPADRRGRTVCLTAAGMRKLKETDALWAVAQARFEAAIGRAESAALRATLVALAGDGFSDAV
ncbi:MarR family transcriptional regulator [Stenotrophomonas tumulicola]